MKKYIKVTKKEPQDFAGMRFGSVTVLKRADIDKWGRQRWIVKCDCGNEKPVLEIVFKRKNYKSCGCYAKLASSKRNKTHGLSKTRTYHTWQNMIDRCDNCNSKSYNNYGKRGIIVSSEWHDFNNFYADMGDKPIGLSLERKNNNGNYCKENCVWATCKEQMNNTRGNKIIIWNGINLNVSEWSDRLRMKRSTLYNRLQRNWEIERALTTPVAYKNK